MDERDERDERLVLLQKLQCILSYRYSPRVMNSNSYQIQVAKATNGQKNGSAEESITQESRT